MTKKVKKNKKNISFDEFKAWLGGVEDLQSADWHPSKEQWNIIREKIDAIIIPANDYVQKPTAPFYAPPQTVMQQPLRYNVPAVPEQQEQLIQQPTNRHVSKLPPQFTGGASAIDESSEPVSPFA